MRNRNDAQIKRLENDLVLSAKASNEFILKHERNEVLLQLKEDTLRAALERHEASSVQHAATIRSLLVCITIIPSPSTSSAAHSAVRMIRRNSTALTL